MLTFSENKLVAYSIFLVDFAGLIAGRGVMLHERSLVDLMKVQLELLYYTSEKWDVKN
jgi:hypothetical protein